VTERPFRFRLERLRWLRQQAERSAQEELAASLGRQRSDERSLREIEATIAGARESERAAAAPSDPPRSGSELAAANAYLERLAGRRALAARELAASSGEVDERRRSLQLAARERRALDRLRDRRRAEHSLEATRSEGAQLDELALAAHRRGRAA
jgi:flagellar FliJ protein